MRSTGADLISITAENGINPVQCEIAVFVLVSFLADVPVAEERVGDAVLSRGIGSRHFTIRAVVVVAGAYTVVDHFAGTHSAIPCARARRVKDASSCLPLERIVGAHIGFLADANRGISSASIDRGAPEYGCFDGVHCARERLAQEDVDPVRVSPTQSTRVAVRAREHLLQRRGGHIMHTLQAVLTRDNEYHRFPTHVN